MTAIDSLHNILSKESNKGVLVGRIIHGECGTRLYKAWRAMKDRCFNSKNKRYLDYGGRGITVCSEWGNSYVNFAKWARSNGYESDLTIDRINNDGNYEPNNCRWSTRAMQSRNNRANINITIGGVTRCLAEWCEAKGVPRSTIQRRYQKGIRGSDLFKDNLFLKSDAYINGEKDGGSVVSRYRVVIPVGSYQTLEEAMEVRDKCMIAISEVI